MKISEQAAVIALRHSEMFSQGKRNDIIRELEMLENPDMVTSDPVGMKSADVNDNIGEQYGLGRSSVVRLVRIDKLIPELKALIDNGSLAIRSGVELSFLSEETQETVAEQSEDFKIDMKKAKALREAADSEGDIDTAAIVRIITGTGNVKPKPRNVKISDEVYSRFFTADMKKKEVTETIEKALAFYFANMEENDDE